jgi:hypothetical protein
MPKTQYFTAASLDGFIAGSGNSLDWLFQAEATAKAESASGDLYHEFYAQVGALAMGATTHSRAGQGQHRPPSLRPDRSRRDISLAVKQ